MLSKLANSPLPVGIEKTYFKWVGFDKLVSNWNLPFFYSFQDRVYRSQTKQWNAWISNYKFESDRVEDSKWEFLTIWSLIRWKFRHANLKLATSHEIFWWKLWTEIETLNSRDNCLWNLYIFLNELIKHVGTLQQLKKRAALEQSKQNFMSKFQAFSHDSNWFVQTQGLKVSSWNSIMRRDWLLFLVRLKKL